MRNLPIQALRNVAIVGADEETRKKAEADWHKREALINQAHLLVCQANDLEFFTTVDDDGTRRVLDPASVRDIHQVEMADIEPGVYAIPVDVAIANIGLFDLGQRFDGDYVYVKVSMSDWEQQPAWWREYELVNTAFSKTIEITEGYRYHKDNPKWIAAILSVRFLLNHDTRVVKVESGDLAVMLRTEQLTKDDVAVALAKA